jgi:hypothetical protein
MTRANASIFALTGFAVWLVGAILFRLGGHVLFESGTWVLLVAALSTAVSVCFLLGATMGWRNAPASSAVTVAVVMALPGLFGVSSDHRTRAKRGGKLRGPGDLRQRSAAGLRAHSLKGDHLAPPFAARLAPRLASVAKLGVG